MGTKLDSDQKITSTQESQVKNEKQAFAKENQISEVENSLYNHKLAK